MRRQFLALVTRSARRSSLSVGVGRLDRRARGGKDADPRAAGNARPRSPARRRSSGARAQAALEMKLKGKIPAGREGRQGREGPVRRARPRGRGLDLDRARRVRNGDRSRSLTARGGTPGPLTTRSRSPTATVDNTTIWTPDFIAGATTRTCCSPRRRATSRCANFYIEQSSSRYTVNGDVDGLGRACRSTTARYGPNYCGGIVCARHVARSSTTRVDAWYAEQLESARPPTDQRVPLAVRRLGSLRLRRRRQLQRARRLHRPLPVGPRRRGRGDRRRRAGRRRDLVAPLVRRSAAARRHRAARRQHALGGVQIGDIELLDRRLHGRAGERRRRRLRARVRPRPRPARPLRHVGQHRRRGELAPASGR